MTGKQRKNDIFVILVNKAALFNSIKLHLVFSREIAT